MLMVNALAGTGKTTTGSWGLGRKIPKNVSPSEEQKSIVRIMRGCRGSKGACAFNKSIALELESRVPPGVVCATSNAFGHRAWAKHVDSRLNVDGLKNRKICREIIGKSLRWKDRMSIETSVDNILSLCKCYLFDPTTSEKENDIGQLVDGQGAAKWLADRFDIDFNASIYDYLCQTFLKGIEVNSYIDYNDQNFLPIYHNVPLQEFGHLMVDEVQDLNRSKQEMAFRMGKELTCIGDVNQAIYGFSGADSNAMNNMLSRMGSDAKELPLTLTRRCSKSVVRLANTIVPELRCPEDAIEGKVSDMSQEDFHKVVGDYPSMVLCRVNAPLMSLAFKLLGQGKRCYIQGKDIGKGLKNEIKRSKDNDLTRAMSKVYNRINEKKIEIASRAFPDDAQIEALNDKVNCLSILSSDVDTIDQLFLKIDGLFKDSGSKEDICLSSVHKAKGLEHERVYIYKSNKLMLPMKMEHQRQQERNLAYVAYTRSLNELTKVHSSGE